MFTISDVLKFILGSCMLAALVIPFDYQQINYDRCVESGKDNCAARFGMPQ